MNRYSKHIIWLKASLTNNDPEVIAWFYLKGVEHNEGKNLNGGNYLLSISQAAFSHSCSLPMCDYLDTRLNFRDAKDITL